MSIVLAVGIGLLAAMQAVAQAAPAILQNTGKPMQVEFRCTDEDMQWAGMSCTEEEPCPVYLELAAVESVGNRIFLAGNIHSASVTLYSVLLASSDAGQSWQEAYERVRGAGLDHIQFVDFETGWVGGQLLFPLPQDPFLLLTTDGGKSWRRRPIFNEPRSGSIQQFWFSSRNNGSVVIDRAQSGESSRYELYESPSGGESWMIKEVNERPIRLKRALPGAADWRIRADASSKSFKIERQQGERWNAIAGFLVPIGACKPAPRVEAPPPAEAPKIEVTPAPKRPSTPPTLKRPPRQSP